MRIVALLVTHHLDEEALPWFARAREVFDELVIFIDARRATPGTWERAQQVASRVYRCEADAFFALDFYAMFAACDSDWIIYLDHDEELSLEWDDDSWRRLLQDTPCTHFWFPRRWIVAGGYYIDQEPWWPDLQLRLFRNDPSAITVPRKPHERVQVAGDAACFTTLAIHHHVLRLAARKQREEKVKYYESLRPGGALDHFYLHENYQPRTAPVPHRRTIDEAGELVRMEPLPREEIRRVSLHVGDVPATVVPGELFWLDVEVQNDTPLPLAPCPPAPARLAFHWLEKTSRRPIVFDGERSTIFPYAPAHATSRCAMMVTAPPETGECLLQITMVQEGVCWFEEVNPEVLREFSVTVRPGREH